MDPQDREKLKKNLVTLVKGLTLDEEFIANLESEGMLTTAMVEELLTRPEMTKRVSHFVSSLLPRRGPRAFETFIKTCVMTGQVRSTPFTSLEHISHFWFTHAGCVRDRDQDMDEWVIWFYIRTFHTAPEQGQGTMGYVPIFRSYNCFSCCVLMIFQ